MTIDRTGTVRALALRVCKALPLVISSLAVAAGYYLIWSVSPESAMETVLLKTRAGLLLVINGGLLLIISLQRFTK